MGPFSGRQLVLIVIALVVGAVLTPVAVGAATGSVTIEDATHPEQGIVAGGSSRSTPGSELLRDRLHRDPGVEP